ncbi:MAG: glycosyltransferase [Pseudomonadota bacterium]
MNCLKPDRNIQLSAAAENISLAVVTGSMSRRAGGLFNSVRFLSRHLEQAGVGLKVFAGEDEFSAKDRSAWGETPLQTFPVRGPQLFGYQPKLLAALRQMQPDIVHLHGIWMYSSIAAMGWSKTTGPRIISPRGMLDPWAVANSAWKKRIAAALYESRNLRGAACVHALAESERLAIRAYGVRTPIAVIPNGVDPSIGDRQSPSPAWEESLPDGARKLLFLGRIHPKKGLAALIEAYQHLRGNEVEQWHLVVAGWDQSGHEAELKAQVTAAGLGSSVHFVGPQFGDDKAATLSAADAFVLPSQSEGLPMAVLEAWAFRLPVLMTGDCNIPEAFPAGAAIEITRNPKSLADSLRQFMALPQAERDRIGEQGRNLVETRFNWPTIADKMSRTYSWVLNGGSCPEWVDLD